MSTAAVKDGFVGNPRPHAHAQLHSFPAASDTTTNTLDAERADRISRLAGLERVATLRGASQHMAQGSSQAQQQHTGYFDNNPSNLYKSTVGSASATGSVGGSAHDSMDKMSEDADDGISSAGLSDEGNASLVGFGETAGSTVSGPISSSSRLVSGSTGAAAPRQPHWPADGPMEGIEGSHVGAASVATSYNPGESLDEGGRANNSNKDHGQGKGFER